MVPGTLVADRFRIAEVAAVGGMGTVYRAHDAQTGKPAAVKVMRTGGAGDADRFNREIRVLAGLSHPGIVEYVANGLTPDGLPFLASEWIDGESLAQRLAREGLTAAESVQVASSAAAALGFAHGYGVVHRDVKPDNLLFAGGDLSRLKVIDFGIARVGEAIDDARLTRTGALLGTLGYMSPEQARGDRTVDARTDIFALGCVLYECLTGRCAFSGSNLLAVRTKIVFAEPPPIEGLAPELPPALVRLVAAMLAKDPDERPGDAATLAVELAALAPPPSTRRRQVRPPQPATHIVRPAVPAARGACVVFAATGRGSEVTPPPRATGLEEELRRAVAPFGARLECLADGVVAISIAENLDDAPVRAARCALAVRGLLPDAAIVLCQSPTADHPLEDAIDRGGLALEELAMRALFAEAVPAAHDPGGIRVDGSIAGLLEAGFLVTRAAGGFLLHGER